MARVPSLLPLALLLGSVALGGCQADSSPSTPPEDPDVTISPSAPRTADDLVATSNVDGATLRWSKDGAVRDDITGPQVDSSLTAKGETWAVDVVWTNGELLAHAEVVIANTPPTMFDTEVQLTGVPNTPVPCAIITPSVDADGDIVNYSATWLRNGVAYAGATMTMFSGDTVPAVDHALDDQFECTVVASDGSEMLTAFAGARVFVPNGVAPNGTPQMFTTPDADALVIEAAGGVGGVDNGVVGSVNGASMIGTFSMPAGAILTILVGQPAGPDPIGSQNLSGGGGTFVLSAADAPLVVAGGGGSHFEANPAVAETVGRVETSGGTVGTTPRSDNGMGGTVEATSTSGAGGGLLTSGAGVGGGRGYMQGAAGGAGPVDETDRGGYGGGGARGGLYGQGAGGGYSGGSCGDTAGTWVGCGGGGSLNMGTPQVNTAGANPGPGYVKITW